MSSIADKTHNHVLIVLDMPFPGQTPSWGGGYSLDDDIYVDGVAKRLAFGIVRLPHTAVGSWLTGCREYQPQRRFTAGTRRVECLLGFRAKVGSCNQAQGVPFTPVARTGVLNLPAFVHRCTRSNNCAILNGEVSQVD